MSDYKGTIVYVGGFKMPDKNAAAHRVLNNAKIFKELGYNVVFCGVDDDISEDEKELIRMGDFWSCPSRYPRSNRQWIKAILSFDHVYSVINKCDNVKCVVAYNMHAVPLYNLLRFCRKRKIFIISDVTEWYENKFSLHPKKALMAIDTFLVMRLLHKRMDGLISISSFLTSYYGKNGMPIVQIPPLVDAAEDIWNQRVFDYEDLIEFVYVGDRGRNKKEKDQLGLLVNCFSTIESYNNFILTVVGITESDFRDDYPESLGAMDSLSGRIEFKGRLSHSESIYALLKADYSIFFRECTRKNMAGFPTKFAEAVTAGIGVVANDVSNIAEYKGIPNVYITNTTSQEEISQVLGRIMKMGNKVAHSINDTFDYHSYVNNMEDFMISIGCSR